MMYIAWAMSIALAFIVGGIYEAWAYTNTIYRKILSDKPLEIKGSVYRLTEIK